MSFLKKNQILREELQTKAAILKVKLKGRGLPVLDYSSHIVPVVVGDPIHTKMLSDKLLEDYSIYVQPINFPTVSRGTERLRLTPSSVHTTQDILHLVNALDELWSMCTINRAEMAS